MAAVAALAIWLWPASGRWRETVTRRARSSGIARSNRPVGPLRGPVPIAASILGLGIAPLVGALVGLAAALLAGTVGALVAGELRRRRNRLVVADLLSALRTLAREVRAGAQPLAAITTTASTHGGTSAAVLGSLTGVMSTGRAPTGSPPTGSPPTGRPPAGAKTPPRGVDVLAATSTRLAVGWTLSARHGVPWSSLIDATAADLADRVRADAARAAQVSGPRVSGYVLAVLPVLGLLLGAGMGADPLHVLLQTGVGNVLMLVGSVLTCLGLAWTSWIVRT